MKPDTFMNERGRAVGEASRFLKIPEADIVVLHDELDLAPGKVKIKSGGGNAGHNGLRSISAHVGNEYVRVRIGIGHPGSRDAVVHFVLHDFARSDAVWLDPLLDAIADAAPRLAAGDQSRFLTEVARATEPEKPKARENPKARTARSDGNEAARQPVSSTTAAPEKTGDDTAGKEAAPHAPPKSAHPAGERASKRQSAIADNLRKWLAARNKNEQCHPLERCPGGAGRREIALTQSALLPAKALARQPGDEAEGGHARTAGAHARSHGCMSVGSQVRGPAEPDPIVSSLWSCFSSEFQRA